MIFVNVLNIINNIVIINIYVWIIGKLCLSIVFKFNWFSLGYVKIYLIIISLFIIIGIDI